MYIYMYITYNLYIYTYIYIYIYIFIIYILHWFLYNKIFAVYQGRKIFWMICSMRINLASVTERYVSFC